MNRFPDHFLSIREFFYKLKGVKPALEEGYLSTKLPRQKLVLKLFLCISFLQGIITLFIDPKYRLDLSYFMLRVSVLAVITLIYALNWRKVISPENLLFITNCSLFFLTSEYLKKNIDDGENMSCFMIGLLIEGQVVSMIIARVDSLKITIFVILTNTMAGSRYLPMNENPNQIYSPIVHIVFNTIFLSIVSHINEKSNRKNFYAHEEKNFSLYCFRELITDVIPNPIVIIHDEDILFANEVAMMTFGCREESEILKTFDEITIDSKSESLLYLFHESFEKESKKYSRDKNKKPSFKDVKGTRLGMNDDIQNFRTSKYPEKFTLFDLLKNSSFNYRKSFLKFFLGAFTKDSETNHLYFDIKMSNVFWEEKDAIMIIFSENKTIKEIKLLKQQSIYKDNLLATVSHDLRTPLNGIIGMISEALESEVPAKKNLNVALRSAKYLLFMINDILDYYQISNGKLRLNFEYFSLWNVIHEVSKLIKFQAKLKGLKFILQNMLPENKKAALIRSDPNRLKQVILNLLGNALKFTSKGSITISLEENLEEEVLNDNLEIPSKKEYLIIDDVYLIKVTDTGIGIKKEDQKKLFKLFGRVDDSSTNALNKAGIGLGLSISQNIVKILNNNMGNGEIKVNSEPGQGSCFYFQLKSTIDVINEENLNADSKEPKINEIYINDGHFSILECKSKQSMLNSQGSINLSEKLINLLIVDDDQINLMIATSYLKNEEYIKFETACNGLQALEKINESAKELKFYDLILMDCNMPIMDGFEATIIIKDLIKNKSIPDVVIIACTANTSESDFDECTKAGMNDFITKPFSKKDLINILNKYLNSKH